MYNNLQYLTVFLSTDLAANMLFRYLVNALPDFMLLYGPMVIIYKRYDYIVNSYSGRLIPLLGFSIRLSIYINR